MLPMSGNAPKVKKVYTGFKQSFQVADHEKIVVDFSKKSFEIPKAPMILWELVWEEISQELVLAFVEKLLLPLRSRSMGVVIDRTEKRERPWREVLSWLPEEIPAFLHLEGGSFQDLPYELLDCLHIIWENSYPYALPVLDEKLQFPPSKRLKKALLLPPGNEGWDRVEHAIEERVIAEDRLIYEWDGVDELTIFPDLLSPAGARMVQGFLATGGSVKEFQGAPA